MDTDTKLAETRKSLQWMFGIIVTVMIVIFGALEKATYDRFETINQRLLMTEKKVETNALSYQDMRVEMRGLRVTLEHLVKAVEEIKNIVEQKTMTK